MSADTVLKSAQAALLDDAAQLAYYGAPLPSPKDGEITRLVEAYRAEPPPERLKIASALTESQVNWLATYAHRMAMVSVRQQSPDMLRNGLAAVLMAAKVTDGRDATMTLSVLYRAAGLLGPGDAAFQAAAVDAPDADAERLVLGFLTRADAAKTIESMGYREETGTRGIVIVYGRQAAPAAW
jgi:hypothetical protein